MSRPSSQTHALCPSHRYDASEATGPGNAQIVPPGHLTNYAQNEDGIVWTLGRLATHMGKEAFTALWQDMQRSTAMVLAAALPRALEVRRTPGLGMGREYMVMLSDTLMPGCK